MSTRKTDSFLTPMAVRVDESAGAMSISPSGRDIVLASRNGLYVIDIDNTYNPPRWFHHLTSWEVADVQWSPHSSRSSWVVSTSNQKALLWDLAKPSGRAIEKIIHGHSRAITDINFHSQRPEILATSSIDSYIHCWDLRDARKPTHSYADFFSGANQVKWNRHNPHILASSHDTRILVWDDRFNSLPVHTIQAHKRKINGLDFSRTSPYLLLSCSNDYTVKQWDLESKENSDKGIPKFTIQTDFPVGRARHTPFGTGCAVMPLRGGNNSVYLIDISSKKRPTHSSTSLDSVHEFSAHTAPVKEFLWRSRNGENPEVEDRQFQLITWAKDNDVRFWPVKKPTLEKVGYVKGLPIPVKLTRYGADYISYHPEPTFKSKVSETPTFKIQNTSSLGSSPKPSVQMRTGSYLSANMQMSQSYKDRHLPFLHATHNSNKRTRQEKYQRKTGPAIMTRSSGPSAFAFNYGRSSLDWLNGVRIGQSALEDITDDYQYEDNDNNDSNNPSALISNLGDEITQFNQKFPLIVFQKILVSEGEIIMKVNTSSTILTGNYENPNDLVTLTVTVKFPPEYPSKPPEFNIVENYKVSSEAIHDLIYELSLFAKNCAKKNMYCLEPCMRIILGEKIAFNENSNEFLGVNPNDDGDENPEVNSKLLDDEEDEEFLPLSPVASSVVDFNHLESTAPRKLMKQNARTCGGYWSKTGLLVCFFSSKPKKNFGNEDGPSYSGIDNLLVRVPSASNDLMTDSYDLGSDADDDIDSFAYFSSDNEGSVDSFRLTKLAVTYDQFAVWSNVRGPNGRKQSNKFNFSHYGPNSTTGRSQGTNSKFLSHNENALKNRIKIVNHYRYLIPARPELAKEYEIMGYPPHLLCQHNSKIAEKYNCPELANCWKLLEMILATEVPLSAPDKIFFEVFMNKKTGNDSAFQDIITYMNGGFQWGNHPFGRQWLIDQLFDYFEKRQDPQMLANMSCILLTVPLYHPNPIPSFSGPPTPSLFIQVPRHKRNTSNFYMDSMLSSPKLNFEELTQMNEEIIQVASAAVPSLARSTGSNSTATAMALQSNNHLSNVNKSRNWYDSVDSDFQETDTIKEETPLGNGPASPERVPTAANYPQVLSSRTESFIQHPQTSGRLNGNPNNLSGALSDADLNLSHMFGTNPATRPMSRNSYCETHSMTGVRGGLAPGALHTMHGSLAQGVGFTYINKELMDDGESLEPIPLLDQYKDSRYKSYRMQYAGLLFSWGLQIESLEVLKFNYMVNPEMYHTNSNSNNRNKTQHHYNKRLSRDDSKSSFYPETKRPERSIFDGFHYSDIRFFNDVSRECQFCFLSVTPHERYFFCLNCEHILHVQCAEEWFTTPVSPLLYGDGDKEISEEYNFECPSGCGCNCMDTIKSKAYDKALPKQ